MRHSIIKRLTSYLLCATLLMGGLCMNAQAADKRDYTIENPYANVDWQSWKQYKASLHNHTWVSDGQNDFQDMIEKYYALDYDILSITDHGTTDYSWTDINTVPALTAVMGVVKRKDLTKPRGLTEERFEEITTGADRGGKGMLRVPFGIEHNPTSFDNSHVCSWFVDYGNGHLGGTSDYETPISNVNALGGVCVINHPGEYTGARNEDDPEKAYNKDYNYKINKFANLLMRYPACIGIDINSKGDHRTRHDRKLWDILLQKVIPTGRNVFGISTADAHRDSAIDNGWTVTCMPENTVDNLKNCLLNGEFFAESHFNENPKELKQFGEEVGLDLGTKWEADYSVTPPKVTEVKVDEAADTITLETENALTVHWIANGEVIHVGNSISLHDFDEKLTCYVRAEVFGKGGILYTQPFVLHYDGEPTATPEKFFDWGNVVRIFGDTALTVLGKSKVFCRFWEKLTGVNPNV